MISTKNLRVYRSSWEFTPSNLHQFINFTSRGRQIFKKSNKKKYVDILNTCRKRACITNSIIACEISRQINLAVYEKIIKYTPTTGNTLKKFKQWQNHINENVTCCSNKQTEMTNQLVKQINNKNKSDNYVVFIENIRESLANKDDY